MSQENPLFSRSFKAEADLSTKQYHFVDFGTNPNEIDIAGAAAALGILSDKPELGWAANVVLLGTTKLIAGTTITKGDEITPDANGQAAVAATTNVVRAIALEDAVADDIFEVFLVYYIKD